MQLGDDKRHSVKSRTLFMIATDFPPLAGTNIQRTQSFVRTLPQHGWHPVVVTQAIEDLALVDLSQLERLPKDLRVERVPSPDPFLRLKRRRGTEPVNLNMDNTTAAPAANRPPAPLGSPLRLVTAIASHALKAALKNMAYLPDSSRPWAMAAARRTIEIIHREGEGVLYTTCPSYSCHVAGLTVKRRTGVPWVADFTDLWVDRPGRHVPTLWHAYNDRRLEAEVVKEADRLIVTSPPWKEVFKKRYGAWVGNKTTCLTLGYEEDKIIRRPSRAQPESHKLVYTGAMYRSETPAPFLQALGELKNEAPDLIDGFSATFIGYAGDELPYLNAIIEQNNLQPYVSLMGPRPHEFCMQQQADADVLLLLNAQNHTDTIRGKTFEYLASGKPILALTPKNGIQADILRQAGTGIIVDHGDVAATKHALRTLLESGAKTYQPDWAYISQFDAQALTAKLAALLSDLTTGP